MHPHRHISATMLRAIALLVLMALAANALGQGKVKVKLLGAKSMKNLKVNGQTVVRHIGNVRFAYSDTYISCDSSYMNSATNSFDAYGHVVITQENTRITGDILHFDGNTSWATVWGKTVQMTDTDNKLTTNQLRYNTRQKYAIYTTGGVMHTPDFDLSSQRGHLYSNENRVAFAQSVVLHNTDADCFTDSLVYTVHNKQATFYGPSYIFHDSSSMYCELGTYNLNYRQATANQHAYLLSDTYKLFGNTIFYDDSTGYAYAKGSVVMMDTANHLRAYGEMAQSWERGKRIRLSEQPFVTLSDSPDTLYLRADTLFVDELQSPLHPDSTYRLLRGVGNVRFHRTDLQGVCDSLRYASLDSIAHMLGNPILWQQNNQITANNIEGHFKNEMIDYAHFKGNAFMATEETPNAHYSQLSGKNIDALFDNGQLHTVNVRGNCQAVYYMREDQEVSTVNRIMSDNAVIGIRNNQITRLRFNQQPKSDLYPVELANPEEVTLNGFKWHGALRPTGRENIITAGVVLIPTETGTARRLELQEFLSTVETPINSNFDFAPAPQTISTQTLPQSNINTSNNGTAPSRHELRKNKREERNRSRLEQNSTMK